jgi:hypothetical protein
MRDLQHVALFLVGVTLGGLSLLHGGCIDWSNPLGQQTSEPVRACPISSTDPDPCAACLATACCAILERCDSDWASSCDHTIACYEGMVYCGDTLDQSSWAVYQCAHEHCSDECVGPPDCMPGGAPSAQAVLGCAGSDGGA